MSLAEIRNIFHLFPCCCMYYQSNTLNILTQQKLRELTESVSMSLGYVDAALLNVWQHVCVLSWILSCFHYCPFFVRTTWIFCSSREAAQSAGKTALFIFALEKKRRGTLGAIYSSLCVFSLTGVVFSARPCTVSGSSWSASTLPGPVCAIRNICSLHCELQQTDQVCMLRCGLFTLFLDTLSHSCSTCALKTTVEAPVPASLYARMRGRT